MNLPTDTSLVDDNCVYQQTGDCDQFAIKYNCIQEPIRLHNLSINVAPFLMATDENVPEKNDMVRKITLKAREN